GSPAPTTTRVVAGDGGAVAATASSGVSEAVATLPDLGRSGIAASGLAWSLGSSGLTDPPAAPEAGASRPIAAFAAAAVPAPPADLPDRVEDAGLSPVAPLAEPPPVAVDRSPFLVDATGGGCGGRPAAIRGRGAAVPEGGGLGDCSGGLLEAAGAGWRAEVRGAPDGEVAVVALVEPAAGVGGDARKPAGSRPLPPGGVLPEF